jgi:hypothetical protein
MQNPWCYIRPAFSEMYEISKSAGNRQGKFSIFGVIIGKFIEKKVPGITESVSKAQRLVTNSVSKKKLSKEHF